MLKERKLVDPIVYSHILFVVNSALYAISSYYLLSIILSLCTVCSFLYHLSYEQNLFWKRMDHAMCVVSLLFIFGHLALFAAPFAILLSFLWLLFSLIIYKIGKFNYEVFHTLWHIAVFLGNVLVWHFLI